MRSPAQTGTPVLHKADAERLDRRIRLMANSISESLSKMYELVEQAKAGQIHVALGYASWTAYVADACKIDIKIDRDQRRELVGWLSDEGMSQRSIAQTLGVSKNTVTADLSQIGTPDEEIVSTYFSDAAEAADVMAMADVPAQVFENVLAEARAEGDLSRENVSNKCRAAQQKSTGPDGKQYPRHRQQQPRRQPLIDDFRSEILKWRPRVDRLATLGADDRVARNQESLIGYRNDLIRFRDTLNEVIDQLGGEQ